MSDILFYDNGRLVRSTVGNNIIVKRISLFKQIHSNSNSGKQQCIDRPTYLSLFFGTVSHSKIGIVFQKHSNLFLIGLKFSNTKFEKKKIEFWNSIPKSTSLTSSRKCVPFIMADVNFNIGYPVKDNSTGE